MERDDVRKLRVLHLVGSPVSDFYCQLSIVYAKEVVILPGFTYYFALVHPDGRWQLGTSLMDLSEKLSFSAILPQLLDLALDLVVPHMFCVPGMTSYRSLFEDIVGIPIVGSSAGCTALAARKAQTRSVVSDVGVRVAPAQRLYPGDQPMLPPPFVIKPNSEDNSLGLTLVHDRDQIPVALQVGFEFDNTLLAEEFIPGREIRVAVIETDMGLYVPAMIEYLVSTENPIRTVEDKLQLRADGTPERQPAQPAAPPVCPADLSPDLFTQLADAARQAHRALGCRDYSLYDFRIHQETETPYLLEAGLFWSFSPISMISRMVMADGQDLETRVRDLWRRAAGRTRLPSGSIRKHPQERQVI